MGDGMGVGFFAIRQKELKGKNEKVLQNLNGQILQHFTAVLCFASFVSSFRRRISDNMD